MNSPILRDDSSMNRLYSFLKNDGGLVAENIKRIKSHVFMLEDVDGKMYILKRFKNYPIVSQQWAFFKQCKELDDHYVSFKEFPNGKKILRDSYSYYWVISPYVNGKGLIFSKRKDRKEAIKILHRFHEKAMGTEIDDVILKSPIVYRMKKRLNRFKRTKKIFIEHNQLDLYIHIEKIASRTLYDWEALDWYTIENEASQKWSWIHGDVASHNFLRDVNSKNIYMIDFDLLTQAPVVYDWIQLAQRFLPYIDEDLKLLMQYQVFEQLTSDKYWILGTAFPGDVLREWLFFLRKKPSPIEVERYLKELKKQWQKRSKFVTDLENMLR